MRSAFEIYVYSESDYARSDSWFRGEDCTWSNQAYNPINPRPGLLKRLPTALTEQRAILPSERPQIFQSLFRSITVYLKFSSKIPYVM